jgi:hypothetical protein
VKAILPTRSWFANGGVLRGGIPSLAERRRPMLQDNLGQRSISSAARLPERIALREAQKFHGEGIC